MTENDDRRIVAVEEPPLSPASKLFLTPRFNFFIITIFGFKKKIDPTVFVQGLKESMLKHPRFRSKPVNLDGKSGKPKWIKTSVKAEDHIIVPDLDPEMGDTDQFVEDYVSNLSRVPMDMSRPLWEIHLLNLKTSEAEATGVIKVHHAVGDGTSLMSLILACTRKTSDPEALPTFPTKNRRDVSRSSAGGSMVWLLVWALWSMVVFFLNTCVDLLLFVATVFFLKDSKTAIKGGPDTEFNPKRFVHRTVSLDDIKLIKKATKMTINDVVLGIIQAGLSRYLNKKHAGGKEQDGEAISNPSNFFKRIRLRGAIIANLRPTAGITKLADMMARGSKCRWGNWFGYMLFPFSATLESDPLDYVRKAKARIDRKKSSFESLFSFASYKYIMKMMGDKAGAATTTRVFANTTLTMSNVVGPVEEISLYGHPITFIAPTIFGHPHALTLHVMTYVNKMKIVLAVDPTVIEDPYQLLDDLEESLWAIKAAVLERGWLPENMT